MNSGDIPDVFDVESGTAAQKYNEYAYNWTEDKEVLGKFKEAAWKREKTGTETSCHFHGPMRIWA